MVAVNPTMRWTLLAICMVLVACDSSRTSPKSHNELFAEYFQPPEDYATEGILLELGHGGLGTNYNALESLKKGMEHYNAKEYKKAIPLFEKVLTNENDRDVFNPRLISFYQAISYLAENDFETAIPLLKALSTNEKFEYKTDSQYYLALAYVRQKETQKARNTLKGVLKTPKHNHQAKELLENLEDC